MDSCLDIEIYLLYINVTWRSSRLFMRVCVRLTTVFCVTVLFGSYLPPPPLPSPSQSTTETHCVLEMEAVH